MLSRCIERHRANDDSGGYPDQARFGVRDGGIENRDNFEFFSAPRIRAAQRWLTRAAQ